MGRKSVSLAYYQIINIPSESEFLVIYNHIIDGLYILERVFKKNHKIRKFDISEMWQHKFENGIATFDKNHRIKNFSFFLEMDLRGVFQFAHNCWLKKKNPEELLKMRFWLVLEK